MPEGPEIKTIVDNLILLFINKKLKFLGAKNISPSLDKFIGMSAGIPEAHGKAIYIPIGNIYIKIHLMLKGHLFTEPKPDSIIELYFNDLVISITDPMKLAKIKVVSEIPNTLDIYKMECNNFIETLIKYPNRQIHLVLTDQNIIAGIGKYLKSEILYESRQNPFTKIKDVNLEHLCVILKKLIKKIYNYGGSYKYEGYYKFKIYGKKKDPNGHIINKEKGVYWVPDMQK